MHPEEIEYTHSGQAGYATGPSRPTQVSDQLDRQQAEIEVLHNELAILESRLAIASLPRDDIAKEPGLPPREVMAPLADRLANQTGNIATATMRVRQMIGSLEI